MTIAQIHEWFQLAAQAMFASVALGPERGGWTFYQCEDGPGCAWSVGEFVVSEGVALSWDVPEDCGFIECGSPQEAESLIALAAAEPVGGVH